MRVNFRLFSFYIFSLFIMYLAGVYFGNVLFVLFMFFLIFPVLSLISLIIWYAGVGISQRFSTLMPAKGDTLHYQLMIRNRGFLPIPSVKIHFVSVSRALDAGLQPFVIALEPGTARKRDFQIRCLYRGEYDIGVNALEVRDFFELFSLRKKTQPAKLTVYPRVIELDAVSTAAAIDTGNGRRASAGTLPDPTLFKQLREYRDGDSIRHIYWKKYASIGKPVLKEYELSKRAGTRIYFDTRKNRRTYINDLEQEDVSVEILVALVKHLLDGGVYTTVIAPGWESGSLSSDESTDFEDFYRATIELSFSSEISPAAVYHEDRRNGNLESQAVLLITHIIDPEVFALREHGREQELHFIVNGACYARNDLKEINDMLDSVAEYGATALCIRSGDTIREDLSERFAREI